MSAAFQPSNINKLALQNRIIKAATFEGMTPDGVPGKPLLNFHKQIAEGGVGMTTLSYCTTEADGRIMESMMYLREGIEAQLTEMIAELKNTGVKVSGQVTHCGGFSKNKNLERLEKPLGPSRQFSPIGATAGYYFVGEMSIDDIDYLVETYRNAARIMKRVGFDAAEIHFGHGYGLSQFISPKTNKRTDEYGGSHENRLRLPLRVMAAMREVFGVDFPIIGKISMSDGTKGGVDWDEGLRVAQTLDRNGIDAIVPSAGTSSFNTMLMFRGDSIAKGMIATQTSILAKIGLWCLGPVMYKKYPYRELYLIERAKAVKAVVTCPVIYVGGCSTRESLDRVFEAGFDFVQLGRPLIKDPDFVNNARDNTDYDSGCTHCNFCVPLIEHPDGIRCVLNDDAGAKQ